jgi:hypothetical protein
MVRRETEAAGSAHVESLISRRQPRVVDPLRTNTRAPALPRLQRGSNLRAGDNSNEGGSPVSIRPLYANGRVLASTTC